MRLQVITGDPLPDATFYNKTKVPYYYGNMAKLIRVQRRARDKSQTDIAKILGLSSTRGGQSISNIERGIATIPVKHFTKVARFLGITVRDLYQARVNDELTTTELQVNHYNSLDTIGLN